MLKIDLPPPLRKNSFYVLLFKILFKISCSPDCNTFSYGFMIFFVFFLYTYKFVFTLHCKVFYLKLLFWIPSTEERNNNKHCFLSVYSSPQNFTLEQDCDSDPVQSPDPDLEITTHMYSLKYDFLETFVWYNFKNQFVCPVTTYAYLSNYHFFLSRPQILDIRLD